MFKKTSPNFQYEECEKNGKLKSKVSMYWDKNTIDNICIMYTTSFLSLLTLTCQLHMEYSWL